MKYREVMTHLFTEKIPNWMKYHEENDVRLVRKVYSIGDLRYANDCDFLSSGMSKAAATPLEKLKRHLPSSSNLTLNNNTILTSTLGKLLVRKLTHRSTINMTKSTNDLNNHSQEHDPTTMGEKYLIAKENLEFGEEIAQGKFCTVFKARYRIRPNEISTVAVKKFHSQETPIDLSIYQDVKHPYIIQFIGVTTHLDQSMMLIFEYAPLKSLSHCLLSDDSKREYPINILLEYLKQITSALSYLEKKSIVHKSVSCRNFFVFSKSLIKLSLTIPQTDPNSEQIHHTSDVIAFAKAMWECLSYGQTPLEHGMTNDQIINRDNSANHQRLSRPPYATSELYQIMLLCWKYEPSERPTFSQLEKALADIELKQVRWKDQSISKSINTSDEFLSVESCLLGPLIILDRCLHISQSTNLIQCVSIDGQIGFVENENVEPVHVINLPQSITMNSIFHRKTGIKKNSTKTKTKPISKDMISLPQPDLIHSFHLGVPGNPINEVTTDLNHVEPKLDDNPTCSLLAEVMQAFTEICPERNRNNSSPFPDNHPPMNSCIHNSLSTPDEHSSVSSNHHSHYSSISSLNSRSSSRQKIVEQPSITGQPLPPPPDLSSLGSKLTIATMKENFQLPKSLTLNKCRTKKRFNLFT